MKKMKTMFDCANQIELIDMFKEHIAFTGDCEDAMDWIALFINAYHQVRDKEIAALQYEFEQKLYALTGDKK